MVSELGMLTLNTHTPLSMFLSGSGWEALLGLYQPMVGGQEWVGNS